MEPRILEALRGSIAKWEAIVAGTGHDKGAYNCPLCVAFPDSECCGCPVRAKTGKPDCDSTPYVNWCYHTEWEGDIRVPEQGSDGKAKKEAINMLDFLKSLLPLDALTGQPTDAAALDTSLACPSNTENTGSEASTSSPRI